MLVGQRADLSLLLRSSPTLTIGKHGKFPCNLTLVFCRYAGYQLEIAERVTKTVPAVSPTPLRRQLPLASCHRFPSLLGVVASYWNLQVRSQHSARGSSGRRCGPSETAFVKCAHACVPVSVHVHGCMCMCAGACVHAVKSYS